MQKVGELEFKSRVEELKPAVELNFDPTPAFGEYRRFFPDDAVKHPAKANTKLIEYLVLKYTKPGDIVLDPMAGTGSTCVIASLHGRNSICIDIEERFVEWMKQAKELVEKHQSLKPKGWMIVMQGDARKLSSLLSSIPDTVITSPPYADSKKGEADPEKMAERWEKHRSKEWNTWGASAHTPGRIRGFISLGSGYSNNTDNIGNLPYGSVDSVITSPPYSESLSKTRKGYTTIEQLSYTRQMADTRDDNIANLPHGDIDAVITSPPYESSLEGSSRHTKGGIPSRDWSLGQTGTYATPSKDNIGNLKSSDEEYRMLEMEVNAVITSPPYLKSAEKGGGINKQRPGDVKIGCSTEGRQVSHPDAIDNTTAYGDIDAVITSPPYENVMHGDKDVNKALERLRERVARGEKFSDWMMRVVERGYFQPTPPEAMKGYGDTPGNIGNLQGETYLSAMLKVYSEMYKVLKPGGLAVVIVKPFIREKKVVDLPYHTHLLMTKVGFELVDVLKLRLKTQSFWRILYYKKHPDVPRLNHEYILVYRKSG